MKHSKMARIFRLALASATLITAALCAQAQTVTDLANFNGQIASAPAAPIQATDGNFYGAVSGGGHGQGAIYRMTPKGELSPLYNFCAEPNCSDGEDVTSSPILGNDGNLYGVTSYGGSNGSGTIYRLTLGGKLTVLYNFCPPISCSDGTESYGLTQAGDGNFYGTTFQGGINNSGTIFRISPSGEFKVLYNFCSLANCADGWLPFSPPIQGIDGNLYGTADGGGSMQGGVMYKLTPSGTYSVVRNFCGYGSGFCAAAQPMSLVQDARGNFFGITNFGGAFGNYGAVFEITSAGHFKALHSFDDVSGYPLPGLTVGSDGGIYGKTSGSPFGLNGGTLFEVTSAGSFKQDYTFSADCLTGSGPWWGPLFQGTNGLVYGATIYGGSAGCGPGGTVFALDNHLGPLVRTAPTAGRVGKRVLILGNNLTGTTSVTFNGVPANFKVQKDTFLTAWVPDGATTGTVSVVTPAGTLNSSPQFVVTK